MVGGKGGGGTEDEGDVGGEGRDDFLVGMLELFKNSELGLKEENRKMEK